MNSNVVEFLKQFNYQDPILLKQYINYQNIVQVDKQQFGKTLTQIISFMWEEADIMDLINMSIYMCKDVEPQITTQCLNTLSVLVFKSNLIDLSKKIAKFNIKYYLSNNPQLFLISHINLARIHYRMLNYKKCHNLLERALIKYEPFIFKQMKNSSLTLQKNPSDLILLLNGYLLFAKSLEQLSKKNEMFDVDYKKFYQNGHKICKKYLPNTHYLYIKFGEDFHHGRKSITIKSNTSYRNVNQKKVSLNCNLLLRQLKISQTQQKPIQKIQNFQTTIKTDLFDSGTKSSEKVMSPRQFRISSPKQQIDIQNIIQLKFDNFMKSFHEKKVDPKISQLEKQINELQKENTKIQQNRIEKESEINELKTQIELLKNENQLIHQKLELQENNLLNQEQHQVINQQSTATFLSNPKQINRQSTTEIKNLIQSLTKNTDEVVEQLKIPDLNFSESITDDFEIILKDDQGIEYTIQLQNDTTLIQKIEINDKIKEVHFKIMQNCLQITIDEIESEIIDKKSLQNFVKVAEYHTILPYTCPIKCITNFNRFIQHIISPFVQQNNDIISLSQIPIGLINIKCFIFNQQCQIELHKIELNILRMLIITNDSQCHVDLIFDSSSIDLYFSSFFFYEYEKETIKHILKVINQQENELFDEKKQIYCLHNYCVKNKDKLINLIEQLIQLLEMELTSLFNIDDLNNLLKLLNGQQIQMPNNSQANIRMIQIKINDQATNQKIIIIAENNREKCFEIVIQNSGQTQNIKQICFGQLVYAQVNQCLGLNTSLLDNSDMQMLCHILCQMFEQKQSNLDIDESNHLHESEIIQLNIDCESYSRFYVASTYQVPITITYIGICDKPIGIRIQVFDEISLTETGMFLTISEGVWDKIKKDVIEQQKKFNKPPKFIQSNKMSKNYYLTEILQNYGWVVIFDSISINQETMQVCRIINENKTTYIERLENVLSVFVKTSKSI